MNTRLQVEHPVTEAITGIDLVEQMIRVAYGEKLALEQKDVTLDGWAVESRIYAEDPFRNFLPSIGRLTRYRPPEEGTEDGITVRNDTGVSEGSEITMFYDPMIAKLVTHAPTREEAIAAQGQALDAFLIDGIQHNIPFLSSLHQHPRWIEGKLSTGFIREEYPDGFAVPHPDEETRALMAAAAVAMEVLKYDRLQSQPGRLRPHDGSIPRDWDVKIEDEYIAVTVEEGIASVPLELDIKVGDGPLVSVQSRWVPGEALWVGEIGGEVATIQVRPEQAAVRLSMRGVGAKVKVFTHKRASIDQLMPKKAPPDTSRFLLCPMPGLVVSVDVVEGQEVKAGETLAVVEAMKMQNVLRAERDVTVKAIKAKAGDSMGVDAVIMEFA
jgi:propionyl-CoA carboxylase alpha chain